MKKHLFFLSGLFAVLTSLFFWQGPSALALSTGQEIQAAASSTQIYESDTIFQGTLNWFKKGVTIGQQGSGGVTYFNGSIVNNTTDSNGKDNPVTFGDAVRFDGMLHRGATTGWQNDTTPLQINDNVKVFGSITVDQASTFANDLTLTTATFQGALTASGGINATKAIGASGGYVTTLSQSSTDSATAARSALYLINSGTSASNDYLIYSTPFQVSKDGNTVIAGTLSATGAITANGGITLGDSATLTIGSGETLNATGATLTGLDARSSLSFAVGTVSANTTSTPINGWTPGTALTPVRISAVATANMSGSATTIRLSDDAGTTSDSFTIADGASTGSLTSFTNFNTINTTNGLIVTVVTGTSQATNVNVIVEYTAAVQ